MRAIDTLRSEHRLIESTFNAMLAWTDAVQRRTPAGDKAELRRFLVFLRELVDKCHHGKEEEILFTAMRAHRVRGARSAIEVMLLEHEHGRALLAALDDFAQQPAPWSDDDRSCVVSIVLSYAALMRQQLHKEDTILYPLAAAMLPARSWNELQTRLERFDDIELGRGVHARLHRLAESLIAAYLPHPA